MSESTGCGSPGSHPHADQPNWRPATTITEYMENCREGLETFSQRRAAKLLGMTRMQLWRATWIAKLPEELFERLLARDNVPSTKMLADVARAMYDPESSPEVECCPHCGGLLRVRDIPADVMNIVHQWLGEQDGGGA